MNVTTVGTVGDVGWTGRGNRKPVYAAYVETWVGRLIV